MDIRELASQVVDKVYRKVTEAMVPVAQRIMAVEAAHRTMAEANIQMCQAQKDFASSMEEAHNSLSSEIAAHSFDWEELTRELDDA